MTHHHDAAEAASLTRRSPRIRRTKILPQTPVSPQNESLALLRAAAAARIEALIAFLDETDGDPDLEPGGDEFDASFPNDHRVRLCNPHEDAEDDHAIDDEEHDGREPDEDGEPSLGALYRTERCGDLGQIMQNRLDGLMGHEARRCETGWGGWTGGTDDDCELDHSESGIADLDGLAEQVGRGMGGAAV